MHERSTLSVEELILNSERMERRERWVQTKTILKISGRC